MKYLIHLKNAEVRTLKKKKRGGKRGKKKLARDFWFLARAVCKLLRTVFHSALSNFGVLVPSFLVDTFADRLHSLTMPSSTMVSNRGKVSWIPIWSWWFIINS